MIGKGSLLASGVSLLLLSGTSLALEKVKFGNTFKLAPMYAAVNWVGEEKGIWKKHGLEVEWLGFRGGVDMHQAVAAGALDLGLSGTTSVIESVAKGVSELIFAQFPATMDFAVWVPAASPLKEPKDLRGKRIGVMRTAGSAYAFALFAIKSVGLSQKEVKFVGVGGLPERLAALKRGIIDAFTVGFDPVANLYAAGQLRSLTNAGDYLPKDWVDQVYLARKEFAERQPGSVRKGQDVVFEAVEFVRANRPWVAEKLKSVAGFSPVAAKMVAERLYPQMEKGISRPGLTAVVNFLVDYGVIKKEEAPSLDRIIHPSADVR